MSANVLGVGAIGPQGLEAPGAAGVLWPQVGAALDVGVELAGADE